ncbi:MAG TPA: hypothetical protein VF483_01930, partial [Gemmatimonadaceae bacterium]
MHSLRASLLTLLLSGAAYGQEFRSSLTVTVTDARVASGHECRDVELKWSASPRATKYQAFVANTRNGPWTALPAHTECGAGRVQGPTSVVDAEPAPQKADETRRLYYR